jgi:hypothetical protein
MKACDDVMFAMRTLLVSVDVCAVLFALQRYGFTTSPNIITSVVTTIAKKRTRQPPHSIDTEVRIRMLP